MAASPDQTQLFSWTHVSGMLLTILEYCFINEGEKHWGTPQGQLPPLVSGKGKLGQDIKQPLNWYHWVVSLKLEL